MAVGFTPKHATDFSIDGLTREEFLILTKETAEKLDWQITYLSDAGITAYSSNKIFSWKSEVTVRLNKGVASIKSTSTGNEMVDFGKNKHKVDEFLYRFEDLKQATSKQELAAKYAAIKGSLLPPVELYPESPVKTIKTPKSFFSFLFKKQLKH